MATPSQSPWKSLGRKLWTHALCFKSHWSKSLSVLFHFPHTLKNLAVQDNTLKTLFWMDVLCTLSSQSDCQRQRSSLLVLHSLYSDPNCASLRNKNLIISAPYLNPSWVFCALRRKLSLLCVAWQELHGSRFPSRCSHFLPGKSLPLKFVLHRWFISFCLNNSSLPTWWSLWSPDPDENLSILRARMWCIFSDFWFHA